jgi:hypothetical protein
MDLGFPGYYPGIRESFLLRANFATNILKDQKMEK